MEELLGEIVNGAAIDLVLKLGAFLIVFLSGWALRFAWVRRLRTKAVRAANLPRVEASSRYGFSLDNWSPVGSVDDPPPPRDSTLQWALANGGGPLTTSGSRLRTITITATKPVSFEVLRVWVTYTRKDLPQGTAFLNVSDGLGAGIREPARFRAALGFQGQTRNRFAAKNVSDFDNPKDEAPSPYRLSDATELQIDLMLRFLSEGIYTYSIEVEVAVNGIRRNLNIEKALVGDREFPFTAVFARDPVMVHEEFTEYPHTRWLPGPRPGE